MDFDPQVGGPGRSVSRSAIIESIRGFLDAGGTRTLAADLETGDAGRWPHDRIR